MGPVMYKKEYKKPGIVLGYFLAAIFFGGLLISGAFAQNVDTLKVVSNSGQPGDTVSIFVNLANHSDTVGGFIVVLSFDYNIMRVAQYEQYDPVGDSMYMVWGIYPTGRTLPIPPNQVQYWTITGSASTQGYARIIGYDLFRHQPLAQGSGNVAEVKFAIVGNSNGNHPIAFYDQEDGDNAITNWHGTEMYFPVTVDGYLQITGGNDPPTFDPPLVSPRSAQVGVQLTFDVTAVQPDNHVIYLSATGLPANATFPTVHQAGSVTGTFRFTPQSSQDNTSYEVVFIANDNASTPTQSTVVINVGGTQNPAPTISTPGSQEVAEGDHLEFVVSASDPENEYVTLSASNLPANSSFRGKAGYGVVSDTFYFDPDYTQGPNTYTVTFSASDNSGNTTHSQVAITVIDAINDIIEVAPKQGALPGSIGRDFLVNLRNPLPVYGLQFDLLFDPEILEIHNVVSDSARAYDFEMLDTLMTNGRYRVIILPMNLETIGAGTGPIVTFNVDVDLHADAGPSPISFDSATTVHDSAGTTIELYFENGTFTVDILGDANLDGVINVGDCVAVIANMIGRLSMNIRAKDAADFNRDGDVRISDLQGILYRILGRPFGPPPLMKDAGTVELVKENVYPGYHGEVPLWLDLNTQAGGVQFTVDYDPSQIIINGITAGNMVSDLVLDYNDTGNQIKGVIYDFSLDEFGPAAGELVTLDIDIKNSADKLSNALKLVDFEIVTIDAYKLNVEVLGELPETFQLNQNYPNPFNIRTLISFDMPYSSMVRMDIYNVLGQNVKELYVGYLEAGSHQLIWDGSNSGGDMVTSGIYFYRFQAENFDRTMKMLLVK